ncbi:hypothetical protein BX666DRAFT_182673 [Dichotomocladium elegans]|nr:hypothetical protein BX666DRAFT_182673 [Dichotomocladium elegans]
MHFSFFVLLSLFVSLSFYYQMRKVLPHRHSFPPSTTDAAAASTEVGDNQHHNGGFWRPPGIFIATRSYHRSSSPSSHFSEIEEIGSSSPHLALASSTVAPDLRPLAASAESSIEPYVSPLTEANLKHHTDSYLPCENKDVRHQSISTYVETQACVLQLEAEMHRQQLDEIRSLVPLDTRSFEEEVIQDVPGNDDTLAAESRTADMDGTLKKKRRKWTFFRLFQKEKKHEETSKASFLTDQKQQQPSERRVSHYHQETLDVVFQGMAHGLNNKNIARALGCEHIAMKLFSRPTVAYQVDGSNNNNNNHPRRDSGISVSTFKKRKHRTSMRFAPRLGRVKEAIDEQGEAEDFVARQAASLLPTDRLIGYRYPRMVRRDILRVAAIQLLSSDISFYGSTTDHVDDSDDVDTYFSHSSKRFSDPGSLRLL